jgi:hypothetical protein
LFFGKIDNPTTLVDEISSRETHAIPQPLTTSDPVTSETNTTAATNTTTTNNTKNKKHRFALKADANTKSVVPLEHHHWCPQVYHNFSNSTNSGTKNLYLLKFMIFCYFFFYLFHSFRFGSC